MKIKLFVLSLLLTSGFPLKAQRQNRIGYIDMDYILKNIPQYQKAHANLDKKVNAWKEEIASQQEEIETLRKELESERPLLTQSLLKEGQTKIDDKKKQLKQYRQKRFGPDGDMVKQRRQIVRPIENEVFNAIQEIGERREYDFIFDSSSDAVLLFSANRHDISDQVLNRIKQNTKNHRHQNHRANNVEPGAESLYKSVEQARLDKEKQEAQKDRIEQLKRKRHRKMEKRRQLHDSIREERQRQYNLMHEQNEHKMTSNSAGKIQRPMGVQKKDGILALKSDKNQEKIALIEDNYYFCIT